MDGIPFNGPPPDFAAPPFKDLLNVYIKRAGGDRDQAFQRLLAVWEALKAQWRNGTIPFIVPQPSQWDHDLDLTPTRVHRHLVLTPVGSPLSSFRSQRELLHGLIAGLESMSVLFASCIRAHYRPVHEKLVATKGVLHKDITPHNMMYKDSKRGDRSVLLIDFDYAIPSSSTTQHLKGIVSDVERRCLFSMHLTHHDRECRHMSRCQFYGRLQLPELRGKKTVK